MNYRIDKEVTDIFQPMIVDRIKEMAIREQGIQEVEKIVISKTKTYFTIHFIGNGYQVLDDVEYSILSMIM